MVNTVSARRSPLFEICSPGDYGHVVDNDPGVLLKEKVSLNIIQVDAWKDHTDDVVSAIEQATGVRPSRDPCKATQADNTTALWVGPDRWLIIEKEHRDLEEVILEKLTLDMAAVSDQSHSRCSIQLSGREARNTLRKGTTLDLDESYFMPGDAKITSLFHINGLIHCVDNDIFNVYVARSFGQSFFEVLTHAAAEYGIRIENPE